MELCNRELILFENFVRKSETHEAFKKSFKVFSNEPLIVKLLNERFEFLCDKIWIFEQVIWAIWNYWTNAVVTS